VSTENGVDACRHHWLIAPPGGPISVGVCKLCGAHQEFPNSLAAAGWEKDVPSERLAPSRSLASEDEGGDEKSVSQTS
jgi:hypothetical protein